MKISSRVVIFASSLGMCPVKEFASKVRDSMRMDIKK
jgi:hypothetical protein